MENIRDGYKILSTMKKKTDYLQFKKATEDIGKTYFTLRDLKKVYPYSKESLKVLLSHWVKRGLIDNLGKGFYTFSLANVDYLHLVNDVDKDSYISFEYALYYYNLIDQVPSVITSATKGRSRMISLGNWNFEYTHLKDDLFFGYELKDKIYVATPEKAIADLIYLISRGKRIFELKSMEKEKIDREELQKFLKKYPSYTQKLAKKLGL